MSHFVRASKFRHVYVEPPKPEQCWTGLRLSTATGEQSYISGNNKFFAVGLQGGGGPFAVIPIDKPGRFDPSAPIISGHTANVLDFDFNPFHDHLIASASEDCTVKVWGIPENGLTETITEPLVDLHGHGRKVTLLRFHPTASNVLASTSADFTVKIWDIEKGAELITLEAHEQLIQDIVWDYTGSIYATSCKDKDVRLIDARANTIASHIVEAHEGAKSCKLAFLGPEGKFLSVGFTRQSQRQFKIWDPRNLQQPLTRVDIDQAAGVIMPFYDPDTKLLYLAGKGDGNIRYYECVPETPYCFAISEYRSTTAAKGMCFLPKRGLNIMQCETARALKLLSNSVEPLSFIVPRKSDAFQEDIFPDTFAGIPSHTADEWLAGSDQPPRLMSLAPGAQHVSAQTQSFSPPKSALQLQSELNDALQRIQLLEKLLSENGVQVPK